MTDSEAGVSIELPFSGSANVVNLVTASNHGVPGSFIYRIDSADISVEPPFAPGKLFYNTKVDHSVSMPRQVRNLHIFFLCKYAYIDFLS